MFDLDPHLDKKYRISISTINSSRKVPLSLVIVSRSAFTMEGNTSMGVGRSINSYLTSRVSWLYPKHGVEDNKVL